MGTLDGIINKLPHGAAQNSEKQLKKISKKVLTNENISDIINKLSRRDEHTGP